jgi:hypothetical protein
METQSKICKTQAISLKFNRLNELLSFISLIIFAVYDLFEVADNDLFIFKQIRLFLGYL